MSIEKIVLAFAGAMILLSVSLSHFHTPEWLFFTLFVGVNMFQAAFTGFCPLAKILKLAGARSGTAFS